VRLLGTKPADDSIESKSKDGLTIAWDRVSYADRGRERDAPSFIENLVGRRESSKESILKEQFILVRGFTGCPTVLATPAFHQRGGVISKAFDVEDLALAETCADEWTASHPPVGDAANASIEYKHRETGAVPLTLYTPHRGAWVKSVPSEGALLRKALPARTASPLWTE
jgi:hypothetical protein